MRFRSLRRKASGYAAIPSSHSPKLPHRAMRRRSETLITQLKCAAWPAALNTGRESRQVAVAGSSPFAAPSGYEFPRVTIMEFNHRPQCMTVCAEQARRQFGIPPADRRRDRRATARTLSPRPPAGAGRGALGSLPLPEPIPRSRDKTLIQQGFACPRASCLHTATAILIRAARSRPASELADRSAASASRRHPHAIDDSSVRPPPDPATAAGTKPSGYRAPGPG